MDKATMARNLGVHPWTALASGRNFRQFIRDRKLFIKDTGRSENEFRIAGSMPILYDRTESAGAARGAYFHQDLYVAQEIFKRNPRRHVDVGSRIDGFVAHVAAYRSIEVIDIREVTSSARNIDFTVRDLMISDDGIPNRTDSLSCLHALEHFGLGRYGDPISYYGYKDGLRNLVKMLEVGGVMYLSVPISRDQRIEFNAHRIFSLPYLIDLTAGEGLKLDSLAVVDDAGELHPSVQSDADGIKRTFGFEHGCGMLTLRRE